MQHVARISDIVDGAVSDPLRVKLVPGHNLAVQFLPKLAMKHGSNVGIMFDTDMRAWQLTIIDGRCTQQVLTDDLQEFSGMIESEKLLAYAGNDKFIYVTQMKR